MWTSLSLLSLALSLTVAPLAAAQACKGQSCVIAGYSGSTGVLPPASAKSTGGNKAGEACIREFLESINMPLQTASAKPMDSMHVRDVKARNIAAAPAPGCAMNALIFARGTSEPTVLGVTVGPQLKRQLNKAQPGQWDVIGVPYDPSFSGDNCVGIPGAKIAVKQINELNARCPNTNIIVSGYSQGAMVAHGAVAFANPAAKKQIKGVVVFGDPFNGAPIKDYPSSQIKTFCKDADAVCEGKFIIKPAHLSYAKDSTPEAVKWMIARVRGD